MKLPIKVLLSYLGLGVGCLGTYAAVSVFDNKQIEDVVDDYEKEEESAVVVADSSKANSEPSSTEAVVESEAPRAAPLVASSDIQIKPVKTKATKARTKRSSKPRGARIQTLQRVRDGGPRLWEQFANLASKFVRGR